MLKRSKEMAATLRRSSDRIEILYAPRTNSELVLRCGGSLILVTQCEWSDGWTQIEIGNRTVPEPKSGDIDPYFPRTSIRISTLVHDLDAKSRGCLLLNKI